MTGAQGAGVAAGYADLPLSGGAYSGAVSVPAYLSNGQVAGNGKAWNCILSLRDARARSPTQTSPDRATRARRNRARTRN